MFVLSLDQSPLDMFSFLVKESLLCRKVQAGATGLLERAQKNI